MNGFIDFWHPSRGYGFIYPEEGQGQPQGISFFAHISSFNPIPVNLPTKGLLVTFDVGRGVKGPVALNIRIRHSDPKISELAKASSSSGGTQ